MGSTTALQEIPVGKIDPSPFQTRTFAKNDPELQELAESIDKVGVLEPVLVRAKGKRFELIAGERRLRASKISKLETVPALVRELDDDQAMEVTCIENLQRKDLHPLHEGAAIAMLCGRAGWTQETVAEQIGRPVSYIARRARLTKLSKKWQKVLTDPEHPAASWSASHMDAVACLEPADQDALLGTMKGNQYRNPFATSAAQLRARIEQDYLLRLHSAPWKLADAELVPKAGPCTTCPMRASANPGLFDDIGSKGSVPKNDRCLSVSCWREKKAAYRKRVLEAAREEHGKTIPIITGKWDARDRERHEVYASNYSISTEPLADHKPAIEMREGRSDFGSIVYVKSHSDGRSGTGKKKAADMTAAERLAAGRERLDRKRLRRCVEIATEKLEASKPPAIAALIGLAALVGTRHNRDSMGWALQPIRSLGKDFHSANLWNVVAKIGDAEVNAVLREALWAEIVDVFKGRWHYQGSYTPVDTQWRDAQGLGELLKIDTAAIAADVEAEIPEPKSWAKLREQVKAEKAEAKKSKKRGKEAAAA